MIFATLPPQETSNSKASVVQGAQGQMDESTLTRGDRQEYIKKIVLRYLVERSVRQNDRQGVQLTGVTIHDLQTNSWIVNQNENQVQFAASVNKLPVTLLVLEDLRSGKLKFDQVITWTEADRRDGEGTFDKPGAPTHATVKDLLYDMLNRSGNTAVRTLVNNGMGGAAAINTRLSAIPELPNTRLQPLDANRFYIGNTTPKESLWVLERLMATPDPYSEHVKNALATNVYTELGVKSQLSERNKDLVLVNKIGWLHDPDGNNNHDVGIVYNTKTNKSYGYSMMTTAPYENNAATDRAAQSLKDMGRYLLKFASGKDRDHDDKKWNKYDNRQGIQSTPKAPEQEKKILY
jgi:beta-lactamase class A